MSRAEVFVVLVVQYEYVAVDVFLFDGFFGNRLADSISQVDDASCSADVDSFWIALPIFFSL